MSHGAQLGHNGCLLPAYRECRCQQTRWSQGKKRWDHHAGYSRGWLGVARLDRQSPDNAGGNAPETDRDPVWASAMALRLPVGASPGPLWVWNGWWSSELRHSQPASKDSGQALPANVGSSGASTSFLRAEKAIVTKRSESGIMSLACLSVCH